VGDELQRELQRELPEQAAAIEQSLERAREVSQTLEALLQQEVTLPPDGFWDRRDLKRIAAQLPEGGELPSPWTEGPASEVDLLAALPARFGSDLARPGRIAEARLADLHRRGTWSFDGGREALRALLCERVSAYSGEVRHDLRVRGLVARRGRVVAVGVGDRDETVGAGEVIAAMGAARLCELLSERPPERLAEAAEASAPLHRYRLHLVAPLEALPDALAPLAFSVADPSRPLTGANAIALHTSAGQGAHATLTVEALAEDTSANGLAALRAALRAHVDRLLPFVDRHLAAVWSPHDGLPPEGVAAPAAAPAPMDPLWDFATPRLLGLCGAPHSTGVKGLSLASRQVLPGLGLEGELACGWIAARLVTLRSKRREIDKDALLVGS
jgi:phytoene dehydrogenase-like protein